MCLCGQPYDASCRIAHLGQVTGRMKVFNTNLLTNDPIINRQLIKNPANFYEDTVKHGPILQSTPYVYYEPPIPMPSAPSYNTIMRHNNMG
jgi:hypothetical protein